MTDDMFFSSDSRSLRRGRRTAKRTPTCRPCLLWPSDAAEIQLQGVVLDINPYGMLVRMMEPVPVGTAVHVQLMRDEQFQQPLSAPVEGIVVRQAATEGLFTDHGVRIDQKMVPKSPSQNARRVARPIPPPRSRPRMHTIDITIGDGPVRRK